MADNEASQDMILRHPDGERIRVRSVLCQVIEDDALVPLPAKFQGSARWYTPHAIEESVQSAILKATPEDDITSLLQWCIDRGVPVPFGTYHCHGTLTLPLTRVNRTEA